MNYDLLLQIKISNGEFRVLTQVMENKKSPLLDRERG